MTHCFEYSVHCTYQTIRKESTLGNSRFLFVSPTRPSARIVIVSSFVIIIVRIVVACSEERDK